MWSQPGVVSLEVSLLTERTPRLPRGLAFPDAEEAPGGAADLVFLVELLGRYSKLGRRLDQLDRLAEQVGTGRHATLRPVRQLQVRLRPEQIDEIVHRYGAGQTAPMLAEVFGVHRKTILLALRRRGVEPRYRRLTDEDVAQAACWYQEGWSLARIGAELGADASTVRRALLRIGVQARPRPGTE